MNDFTKEELESLFGALEYIDEDPAWRKPGGWDPVLQSKIEKMIDNYCEHEWVNGTYCEKCDQTPTGGK